MKRDDIGAAYDSFKLMDIGDIIGVKGFVFRTKMGEVSVHAAELVPIIEITQAAAGRQREDRRERQQDHLRSVIR